MKISCGQRFGRLTTIKDVGKNSRRERLWLCSCDCGNQPIVSSRSLISGHTRSCGCFRRERVKEGLTKSHGGSKTHLYKVWAAMKQRCENSNNKSYNNYGGRGIHVCEEWLDFKPFYDWAIENGYKRGLDIDRKNNDLGYSPDNCRFVTRRENCMNKRDNVFLSILGERKTISEWSEKTGMPQKVIQKRLKRGWSAEAAIIAPLGTKIKQLPPQKLAAMMEDWKNAQTDKSASNQ